MAAMPRLLRFVVALAAFFLMPLSGAWALPRVDKGPSCLVYPDFWHTLFGIHRGTPVLLDILLGGRVRFDDPAGV
ncbi:MAG TPA: hypothetical protein VK786_02240, partial [bacterium]|nr:hypothetical protein [bacterium]